MTIKNKIQRVIDKWLSIALLCCLTFISIINSHAQAQVILRERFHHYNIQPQSVAEIKIELRKHSPVNKENQLFHGGTQWKLFPKFGWKIENNLCRIKEVVVYLEGEYTLPKMSNRTTSTETLKRTFDLYYDNLVDHEKGHQALWIEAGEEISRKLKSMPAHYLCEHLKRQGMAMVNDIVADYQMRNSKYDITTEHGKTQGVFIEAQ
ncbi:DUF922 domain-containing protein [Aliiglaciecola litoralis]|uniref:DUF922 domain-containing protein n=1 Tax=Aliiglaciecola litoralis TaxID=582857 RepID=A0ABN1LL00_9ALTE